MGGKNTRKYMAIHNFFEEDQHDLMGGEMTGQADQMPMSHQGDTVMKKSDIFQGGIEQSISRRDKGVSIPLYKVLVKPELE